MKKNYVQEAIDKGKLVRDQVANVKALVEKTGESISDDDAKWFVSAYKKGNTTAVATAEIINQKEAERLRQQELEWLENERPLAILDKAINKLQADIDEWAEDVKKDPFYKLDWSTGTFKTAAKLQVYRHIRRWLENHETQEGWAEIEGEISDRALSGASSPRQSTSTPSNYAHLCETEAWANAARRSFSDSTIGSIKYWFRRHAELTKEENN